MGPGLEALTPADPLREGLYAALLGVYVVLVIIAARRFYRLMLSWGLPENVALYYNRKILHVMGGGVVAVLTPLIFTSPLYPALSALIMAVILALARRRSPMNWFQTRENAYEVNFNLAWGLSLLAVWLATGDPWLAVLPALYISLGDAVTGAVRNMIFARRTKHWVGNMAMALIAVPIGYAAAGLVGAATGFIASLVERFEWKAIDDNILIAIVTTILILAASYYGYLDL